MQRLSLIALALLATLTACSKEEQQKVSEQIGHKQALEQAKQVEQTLNERAQADLKALQAAEQADGK